MKCQCECGNESTTILVNYNEAYHLCANCVFDLINLNLKPEQFKALLRNGHSNTEFYLHSDFYDEDGNALQPHN